MMKMPRGRIREMMEMMVMILKKSARPSTNVGEINVTTRSKGEEITIIVGGANVPSRDMRIIVMIGRGATLTPRGGLVDLTQSLQRSSTIMRPRGPTFGITISMRNGRIREADATMTTKGVVGDTDMEADKVVAMVDIMAVTAADVNIMAADVVTTVAADADIMVGAKATTRIRT